MFFGMRLGLIKLNSKTPLKVPKSTTVALTTLIDMYTAFFFLTKPMQLRICIYKKDHLRIQNCNDMHKHTHKPTHSHHLSVFGNKPKIPAMSSSHVSGNSLQCCCCSFITQIYCLHRHGEFPSIASENQKVFFVTGKQMQHLLLSLAVRRLSAGAVWKFRADN